MERFDLHGFRPWVEARVAKFLNAKSFKMVLIVISLEKSLLFCEVTNCGLNENYSFRV